LFAKLIKSQNTPVKDSPVIILHHGYGSNYRRMLVYAYPLALRGYAVLLYNARGHGRVIKKHGVKIDERSPGKRWEIMEIIRDLSRIIEFIKSRPDLGMIGFVGISLGAIVGLTYGVCHQDVKCVIALAGIHDFKKTATRKLIPFTADWWMKKSFEWSGLEMEPTGLEDFMVSPQFYIDKEFGFFEHPVWTEKKNADKIFLIHAEDDCTVPYWNFLENAKKLGLSSDHCLALKHGNHWFYKVEHLVIGQIIGWLDRALPIPRESS
ncbi:MAG: alpha/beta hydrolase family protein, partial [Promethearchaeota archaeon]